MLILAMLAISTCPNIAPVTDLNITEYAKEKMVYTDATTNIIFTK